jgi:hypothetical protein
MHTKRTFIYQRAISMPNGYKIIQHFPILGSPKYSQIGIFEMQIYHLATLNPSNLKANQIDREKKVISIEKKCKVL